MTLNKSECDIVLAIMDGHITAKELGPVTGLARVSIYGYLHKIYAKANAANMTHLVLMMTGALPCPEVLLPVQRIWRRKHYKLDEISA